MNAWRACAGSLAVAAALIWGQAIAEMTQAEAFSAGKDAGGETARNDIKSGINDTQAGTVVKGYTTTPPPSSSYWTGNQTLVGPVVTGGSALSASCSTGPLPSDPAEAQRCEAIRAINKTVADQPAYSSLLSKTDDLILKGKAITGDPASIVGAINGAYGDCTTTTKTTEGSFAYETCDEALTNATMTCSIGQEVVVDADHLYQCTTTLATLNNGQCTVGVVVKVDATYNYQCKQSPNTVNNYTCNRTLVVTCDPVADGCDAGGVVPNSLTGSAVYSLSFDGSFHRLLVRSPGHWSGNKTYAVDFNFTIADVSKLTWFSLDSFNYDDWLLIAVNGTNVYVGPKGGNQLTVSCGGDMGICTVYNGIGTYAFEQKGDPSESPNMDLRPYLKNGSNTIHFFNISGGSYGYMNVYFSYREACPRNCYDNWDNQCATLEARSK